MCYTPAFLWDDRLQTHHKYHKIYINPEVMKESSLWKLEEDQQTRHAEDPEQG